MAVEAEEMVLVDAARLEQYVVDCFRVCGMDEKDAREAMEVLIKADITGVDSHGVPRLRNYITRLRNGSAKTHPDVRIVHELPSTARVDGDNGLGMTVGRRGMEIAIEKAKNTGAGFVSVYNSSHYGTGLRAHGFEHDMIGISSTNVGAGGGTPPQAGVRECRHQPLAVAYPRRRILHGSWISQQPSWPPGSCKSPSAVSTMCLLAGSWIARAT
jgi:LDH2 family malate/lactate/ureidoglycolate dehydrogenase